ncbi:MAG: alpha-L-fucosidase [[Clostridium] fimetarium]|nr:alpha-L-fucosidase [Alistipes timonensis]MCM1406531.1 alpha-L-fucosidase [[Clostridium] fimetarium]
MANRLKLLILILTSSVAAFAAGTGLEKEQWWRDSKFGMFIHWGVYSCYAGEYKDSGKRYTEFVMLQARIPLAEYREVAAGFDPREFDADAWVRAAKGAGMKYLVFTAKHHDGFAMYDSEASDFNICRVSPFGRDPLGELAAACRANGLKLGVYYSLGRDWEDPDTPTNWPAKGARSNTWDYPDEDAKDFSRYLERKAVPQLKEILGKYDPDIIWFDTPEEITPAQSANLRGIIEAHNPGILVNQRIGNGYGDFLVLEQAQSDSIIAKPWESCVTLSRNWGYVKADREFKSPTKIISVLVDIVSKGGNLLLNAGPTGSGTLRPENLAQLERVGKWMAANGEAIYGTRPWIVSGESDPGKARVECGVFDDTEYDATEQSSGDIRFTSRDDKTIYIIARDWKDPAVVSRVLSAESHPVASVAALCDGGDVVWRQDGLGLSIEVPESLRHAEIPVYAFRVKLR